MIKNNIYYEWYASVSVPNPELVGYWIDLGADSKGRIIKTYNHDLKRWVVLFDVSKDDYVPPFIGSNGNWWVDNRDTGVSATSKSPYIGDNDHWFVYDPINKVWSDTGIEARGLSAYEVAVKNGYQGSEKDWINSLSAASEEAAAVALEAANKANEATAAANEAIETINEIAEDVTQVASDAKEFTTNPPKIIDGNWWFWDLDQDKYIDSGVQAIGDAFTYKKEYSSIEEMEADLGTADVKIGEYVLINTGDVEDPDDAKVYLKTSNGWKFIVDLSGMQGMQGWSAYEVAVKNGFIGTEADWLQSLKQPALDAAEEALAAKDAVEVTEAAVKEAEAARVEAEDARVTAENARVNNENERISAENARKTAEDARASAEATRISNENTRISNENTRKANEDARIQAESERAGAESLRAAAESERITNEQGRVAAENARVQAENTRANAENLRVEAENARVAAETAREEAEGIREDNEAIRQANEAIRQQQEADRQQNTADAIAAAQQATTAAQQATTTATTAATYANTQANRAKEYADNPPKIETNYWYVWDEESDAYVNTNIPATGEPGKSPKIQDGTWWIYNNESGEYENTNISVSSDYELTKEKVENVLTGNITSHTHNQYLTDAPSDGSQYVRQDGNWAAVQIPEIDLSNYLGKDNTTEYTPTGDYNPATKKYVDDKTSIGVIDLSLFVGESGTLSSEQLASVDEQLSKQVIIVHSNDYDQNYVAILAYTAFGQTVVTYGSDSIWNSLNINTTTGAWNTGSVGLALESDVLTKTNTTEFTPDSDYEPATKKYVDDKVTTYELPIATADTLGGVKVGAGLAINSETGVLSATGGGVADAVDWANITSKPNFATVATSGSYNDLSDKPTIPDLSEVNAAVAANTEAIQANTTAIQSKVDKVNGKQLSTEDYTTEDKTKLAGIAAGAEVNVNADWNATEGDAQILNKPDLTKYNNLPTWVFDASALYTEEGDDYITVHGNKKNLQTGETTNIGSTIHVATSEHIGYMSPSDRTTLDTLAANAITSSEVDQKINSAIASVYRVKGTVANYAALPTTDVVVGDVYNLEDTGANYVATSTTPTWDKLSETVDLSAYSTTVQNDAKYQPKGNYLTSIPAEYVTDTELNSKNYATKSEIPTNISQLTNDSGYLTTIPVATSSTIGGITIGYAESGKNYAVKLSSNKAYVTVPWVNTTYSNATASTAGLMSSTDKSKLDSLNNYTLTQATGSALGGIKIGYTENGKNYPVELSDGKAFVNVPWTDTNTTYDNATTSTAGLLSATDKAKLDSIPSDVVEEAPLDDKQYARQNGEWVEVEAAPANETVKITVTSNQTQPDSNINGVEITVAYSGIGTVLTWEGSELTATVPVNFTYTVNGSNVNGYATPAEQEYIAQSGNTRSITLTYNSTLTTFTSNVAATLTCTGGYSNTFNSITSTTAKVPTGAQYTVTPSNVKTITASDYNAYVTPSAQSITATGNTQTVSFNYTSTYVTLTYTQQTEAGISFPTATCTLKKNGSTACTFTIANGASKNIRLDDVNNTNTWTVEFNEADGFAKPDTITIDATGGNKSYSFNYEVLTEDTHAMWVEFDENNSTTTLQRGGNLDVITSLTSKFKRCLALPQANGTAAIAYLNDTDSTKWPDGSTVDVINGGSNYYMVHFPKYYYKSVSTDTNKWRLYISESKINDDYKEERECLIGVFEAYSNAGSRLASCRGVKSIGNKTITQFYELAQLNGSKWGLIDYRAHKTIANLFCAKYGNTDISTSNSSIPCSGGTRAYNANVGSTLSLGNQDGKSGNSSSFLGVEDCYYGKWEFVQGINFMNSFNYIHNLVYDGGLKVDTTNDSDLTSAGFTNIRRLNSTISDAWISSIFHGEYADVVPTEGGGSSTTGYADYCSVGAGYRVFARSGHSGVGSYCGVFTTDCSNQSSYSAVAYGSRLGFYGTIVEKTKDEFIALYPDYEG